MITPRQYLSWSQLNTLESSIEQYKKIYIDGNKFRANRGMRLGKIIADSLENAEYTGDVIKDIVMAKLPKFELMDDEFHTIIDVANIKIPLFSKIDTAKKDLTSFKEYKTGTIKWDQKRADESRQITFYSVVLYEMNGGKIPKDIELIYMPSYIDNKGNYQLTGEVKTFKTKRDLKDILQMKISMKNAWLKIGELVQSEMF